MRYLCALYLPLYGCIKFGYLSGWVGWEGWLTLIIGLISVQSNNFDLLILDWLGLSLAIKPNISPWKGVLNHDRKNIIKSEYCNYEIVERNSLVCVEGHCIVLAGSAR